MSYHIHCIVFLELLFLFVVPFSLLKNNEYCINYYPNAAYTIILKSSIWEPSEHRILADLTQHGQIENKHNMPS